LLVVLTVSGMRRSNFIYFVMLSVVLCSLLVFIGASVPAAVQLSQQASGEGGGDGRKRLLGPLFSGGGVAFLEATALCFVAFTGYGRVARLGEEVRRLRQTIPRSIVWTLGLSSLL
jgi:APA family basic amino acid/polyamine antiporter